MTIYLDVVFIENICMNCIILFTTGLVTKSRCRFLRIISASFIGALYVIGKYLNNNEMYSNLFIQIGLSHVMVYIAFSPNTLRKTFKYVLIFYLTTFVFGGCAFALLYYVKPQDILYKNGMLKGTYPIKIAILGAILGLVILNIAFKLIKNRMSRNDMFCDVSIGYKGKTTNIHAIIDSGNMLKEPITGFSVIVVEREKLEEILDKKILDNLQEIISGNYEEIDEEYISKFRLIPFSSLGKQNGMLLGFKPDWITISFDESKKSLTKVIIRHI
ncbi:MAG: sigma-E processing peptidase SpoIIGA [Clostridia bacterium]|nr:sigma-E processing peptidase SpoIIGA [Clostridia bacterium]